MSLQTRVELTVTLPKVPAALSTDLTVLKGITVTPTKKSAQAREAIRKLQENAAA